MRKPAFAFAKTKAQISCMVTAQLGRHGGLVVKCQTLELGQGFDPHSCRRVVSLSKIVLHLHVPPKRTGNTKGGVAPSRHD